MKHVRRWSVHTGLLAILPAIVLMAGCFRGAPSANIPYVILISLDTTRADHMGFLGNPMVKTPELDALAAESIIFSDFMTVVPTTLASHTSLFTGKYPHHHGTPRNGFMVNRENTLLAEILQKDGFRTVGFIGSFALARRFDIAQGFDHYDETFSVLVGESGADQNQRSAAEVTDAVIGYLDETGISERLFLFAHYFDPHFPYAPPAPFDTLYDPQGATGLSSIDEMNNDKSVTPQEADQLLQRHEMAYAGEVSYMDHHIGRLLDYLRGKNVLDDALIVVTSDHGENHRDHPAYFNHGFTVYQSTMRGVCLIRLPKGVNGGTRVDQVVANIDILPSLLDFIGLDTPSPIDGEAIDLTHIDSYLPPRTRFGQATKPKQAETDPRWPNMKKARCIRQTRYKLIEIPYQQHHALYDLVEDPGETRNLLENPPPAIARLAEQLRGELRSWAAAAEPLAIETEEKQREETLERLRSLGYTD